MEEDASRQMVERFSKGWSCSCGGSFELARVEVISKTKNSLLARYSCQICGREQVLNFPADWKREPGKSLQVEVPVAAISCNDALDIKEEIAKVSNYQIKALAQKKVLVKATTSKITHL